MRYHRFQLLIAADRAGGYTLLALTSNGKGQAEAHVEPPWPDINSRAISPLRRGPGALRNLTLHGTDSAPSPETLGELLFKALFQEDIRGLYKSSLDAAASAQTGLRIELTFNPQNSDLISVQALPWELLRPPGTPDFLALNLQTPLTRFLIVPRAIPAATPPQTLRILAVRPLSSAVLDLDLDKELRNLQDAVGSAAQVIPVPPTLDALRQALRHPESHVFHFMGHGEALEGQAENALLFEDDKGNPDPVTGSNLANVLAASPSLRLVVLNACDTASVRESGAGGEDFNPFTGVANALVLGGLPAVVGMQHPISDAAAITFSRTFYTRLAAGEPVDAAVTEGRRAMYVQDRASLEWATPVLFLRTPTGELYPKEDLWDRPPQNRRVWWLAAAALLTLVLAGAAGLAFCHWRAERLVTEGAALAGQEQWTAAHERFEAAHRLDPGSAEILSNLAGAEERLGDLRAAEDHYREAVQMQPDSAEHLYNLGHFLNSRQSYDEAYRFLLQAVERDPQRADTHAELAEAAASLGMPGRARVHLEAALRLDPQSPSLHRRLGELELDTGNLQPAILHLNEALRRYPLGDLGRVETTWLLARAYDRLGDTPSACREIQEIRRLDPPGITPWAQKAEEMFSRCASRGPR